MTIDVTYLSGKVKKTPPSQVSSDRYQWLKPGDVEPDLGVPLLDNSVAASLTDGTRKWLAFSNGLTISNNNVSVDETTVPIDTTDFIYSQSDTLAEVLADFDKNIANAVGGTLVSVSTDTTLTGSGTTTSPLSVVKWATPIALSLAGDLVGQVSFDGSGNVTLTANVESVGTIQAGSLDLSSPTTVTAQAGRLWYDSATGSLNFGMGGGNITQQIGEELFIYGKASAAISEGQVVAKTGAVGNSGVITFAPAPIGTIDASLIIGLATENIAVGAFGRVTRLGIVHKIDTTGVSYGETWNAGDTVYYNHSVVGGLTKVKPIAPNQKTVIGTIVNVHATAGTIQVDLSRSSELGGTDSNVELSAVNDNDVLVYVAATGRWENKAPSAVVSSNADTLDGQHGVYYLDYRNHTNKPIYSGSTAPSNPVGNDLWWDPDVGTLFIYYDNGSTAQWVEATPQVLVEGPSGTFTLSGNLITTGDLTVEGTLYETSDRTLKENITTIESPLETVKRLRGVNFDWIKNKKQSMGLIAQEVEEILPFLVQEEHNGNKTIHYTAIIGLLIEAVKELSEKVNNGN